MDRPLVSIITPTYNAARFVHETIRSIQRQTCGDWEMLITDDNSTDATPALIDQIASEDGRIRVFKLNTNSGAGVARNNSIKQAQGRYIAFCDSDDQWMPDKLERQIAFMQKHDLALTYASYTRIDEEGKPVGLVHCRPRLSYQDMLRNNYIGCLTAMYDTDKVGKVYMPDIRKRQDWALWLKIIKEHGDARGLDETLAIYRARSGSISSNKLEMVKYNWIIYRDLERLGLIRTLWLMIAFMWSYALKKTSKG